MTMPTFEKIANNFHSVSIPAIGRFWYSYNICVAFMPFKGTNSYTLFVHENNWSTTTGKHLNMIDEGNKKDRLTDTQFNEVYRDCFSSAIFA